MLNSTENQEQLPIPGYMNVRNIFFPGAKKADLRAKRHSTPDGSLVFIIKDIRYDREVEVIFNPQKKLWSFVRSKGNFGPKITNLKAKIPEVNRKIAKAEERNEGEES